MYYNYEDSGLLEDKTFYFKFKTSINVQDIYTIYILIDDKYEYYNFTNFKEIKKLGFDIDNNNLDITNLECNPIDCSEDGNQYIIEVLDTDVINPQIQEMKIHLNFKSLEVEFTN